MPGRNGKSSATTTVFVANWSRKRLMVMPYRARVETPRPRGGGDAGRSRRTVRTAEPEREETDGGQAAATRTELARDATELIAHVSCAEMAPRPDLSIGGRPTASRRAI